MADAVIRSLLHDPEYLTTESTRASESIKPAHVVERGGSNDFQKHTTAGGDFTKLVADLQDGDGGNIGDAYGSGDTMRLLRFQSGDKLHLRLGFGSDEHNVSAGDPVELNGDGKIRIHEPEFLGEATENKVDSTGVKTFSIAHNRQNSPSASDVTLTLKQEEDVDDFTLDYGPVVTGISSGNIDGEFKVGTASDTTDASVAVVAHIPATGEKLGNAEEGIDNSGASSDSIIKVIVA